MRLPDVNCAIVMSKDVRSHAQVYDEDLQIND